MEEAYDWDGGLLWDSSAPTRNDTLEFGGGLAETLKFIEGVKQDNPGAPVHLVTQLTLSLLGIVVFPYDKLHGDFFPEQSLALKPKGGSVGPSRSMNRKKERLPQ